MTRIYVNMYSEVISVVELILLTHTISHFDIIHAKPILHIAINTVHLFSDNSLPLLTLLLSVA